MSDRITSVFQRSYQPSWVQAVAGASRPAWRHDERHLIDARVAEQGERVDWDHPEQRAHITVWPLVPLTLTPAQAADLLDAVVADIDDMTDAFGPELSGFAAKSQTAATQVQAIANQLRGAA